MHMVGLDVIEQALVVRDEQHAAIGRAHGIDAFGNDLERIDVEARVGLVEDAVLRLEHHHLQDLVALLLTAGETFVDRTRGELAIHFEQIHLGVKVLVIGHRVDFLAFWQTRLQRRADEVGVGNSGHFRGILEGEKDPGARAFVDRHFADVLTVDRHRSARDHITFVTGDHLRQRRFAGSVGSHDGVDFAFGDFEGDALEDFGSVFEGGLEVLDVEAHGGKDVMLLG